MTATSNRDCRPWQYAEMDDADIVLRNLTYRMFVDVGRAPTVDEVAAAAGVTARAIEAAWRLSDAHALVLVEGTSQLLMLNPFSAVPTRYRVRAADRWWFGNCAWDAFGICAALHADGRIETTCADCGDAIEMKVRGRRADPDTFVFHCLVPAEQWWDDIVFT